MTAVDQLFAKALELEPEDRRELAERLMEACDAPDSGWWDSVKDDVQRRLDDLDSGRVRPVTHEHIQNRIAERLRGTAD